MDEGEIARLTREVIARPDDDGVRAVLADVLQANGDPRGELISLQLLAARGNRDRDDRIEELLRENAAQWLGRLRDCAYACCFDRGFPSRLELAAWSPENKRWGEALADPAIATVEDLLRGRAYTEVYTRFVTNAMLTNLRRIEVNDRPTLVAFAESPAPIEHVAFDDSSVYNEPPLEMFFDACAARATLTSLAVRADHVPRLVIQPWFTRIRSLTIVGGVRRALELWPSLHCDLIVVPRPSLEPCERVFPWDYKVELRREGVARISGEWMLYPVTALEALPPVSRVEIELASELIAGRVREVIARPGVEVVERPPRTSNFVWASPSSA